ncbi:hypothetical protein N0V90_000259 [Kalmusia sp. IMI 367209]|nr:hypothetical protein N0V90_000259 [Kalmusia sp. IMI 367209]
MLAQFAWRGFSFAYAFANLLVVIAIAAVRDGAFFKRPSKEEIRELHIGFPDSYLLWNRIIQASSLDSHILVAVDLPGYGGSEGLKNYGANEVLESITEFLLGMRENYLKEGAKFVVVSHDWGAVIAARLASEAPQLADRFIITSALIPEQAYSNAMTKVASAKQMLHTYLRQPLRISLLKNALSTLRPVSSQIKRSFYVFIFNLPYPISTIFPTFGNYWFLRLLHKAGIGRLKDKTYRKLTPKEGGEAMASSIGPGSEQLAATNEYPAALKTRLGSYGMLEKTRIYREGLILGTWEKSIETVVALSEIQSTSPRGSSGSSAGLFDDGPPGALKAPATIVYGDEDPAFEKTLGLDGLGDYLAQGSQVLILEKSGHWLPVEEVGGGVIEGVVAWGLDGEKEGLKERFERREGVTFRVLK